MSHTVRSIARARTAAAGLAVILSCLGSVVGVGPLGGAAPASAEPQPAGSPGVTRYFGRGAYQGIRAAVAATPRTCDLPDDTLTALVMAPIFKEVSMAESPATAPSPMTLSRWDEWTGVASGSTNMNANYGLYAFRDPYGTPYTRAYWSPGIGIFQYDVAGVGAPFTAAEMMNVEFIARDVAGGMASRYCAAGGDGYDRRAAAWKPWSGLGGVAKSEKLLQEMVAPGRPAFSNIGLVDGIEKTGGMLARTCLVGGKETPCAYIDPSLAQGADWWAKDDPSGGSVASGEAPLTAPFYVVKRNGFEERHWMSEDTGYPIDLVARRVLGENARPMDGHPKSGLRWAEGSDLCDTARPKMATCPPEPKAEGKPARKPGSSSAAGRSAKATAGPPAGDEARAHDADGRRRSLVARFGVVDSLDLAGPRSLADRSVRQWESLGA